MATDLQQREQVGEPVAGPVFQFEAHGCHRADEINAGDPRFKFGRRTVFVVPGKKILDGASEQVGTYIAEDRCVSVEGGFHSVTLSGLGAVDVTGG